MTPKVAALAGRFDKDLVLKTSPEALGSVLVEEDGIYSNGSWKIRCGENDVLVSISASSGVRVVIQADVDNPGDT